MDLPTTTSTSAMMRVGRFGEPTVAFHQHHGDGWVRFDLGTVTHHWHFSQLKPAEVAAFTDQLLAAVEELGAWNDNR